jgi:membrane protein implicated in regulation of membrane protease activity
LTTLFWFVGVVAVVVIAAGYLVVKAQRQKPFSGDKGMVGKTAEVRKPNLVYVDGALWKAVSSDGAPLEIGSIVEIVSMDKLTLTVKKSNS